MFSTLVNVWVGGYNFFVMSLTWVYHGTTLWAWVHHGFSRVSLRNLPGNLYSSTISFNSWHCYAEWRSSAWRDVTIWFPHNFNWDLSILHVHIFSKTYNYMIYLSGVRGFICIFALLACLKSGYACVWSWRCFQNHRFRRIKTNDIGVLPYSLPFPIFLQLVMFEYVIMFW